ncbi:hypothetical protein [Streptomyces sp. NPDC006368]|uniref:hypothetical protein n=1 Tax=Streptomyces sp. NPDC006368 TaxID=3156760 RepID=UPI0033A4776F
MTGVSRRLVELRVGRVTRERARRRRRYWSELDEPARGNHPRRSQLRYAVTVLRSS